MRAKSRAAAEAEAEDVAEAVADASPRSRAAADAPHLDGDVFLFDLFSAQAELACGSWGGGGRERGESLA